MKWLKYLGVLALVFGFLAYKLTESPRGITVDEASFGYNGILLSRTLRDENGRFLPIFILSQNKSDWRQPYTQYAIALAFKMLGPSVWSMRITSVITSVISAGMVWFLGNKLLGKWGGLASLFIFAATPIVMFQAHEALDPVMLLPFAAGWLISIYQYGLKKEIKWVIFAGLSLGLGYYAYRGMRAVVPVWAILTAWYIWWTRGKENLKIVSRKIFILGLTLVPFFAVIPRLEFLYAGAVLNNQNIEIKSIYDFIYYYLGNFDVSFLFVRGDEHVWHSTGLHGMFLVSTLPIFVAGIVRILKNGNKFWIMVALAFFTAPILYGSLGSTHRAHRLMFLVPLFSLIAAYGLLWIYKTKKLIGLIIFGLVIINFGDFANYFWRVYPARTDKEFYRTDQDRVWKRMKDEAENNGYGPFVGPELGNETEAERFVRAIYFLQIPEVWDKSDDDIPPKSVYLTSRGDVHGMEMIESVPDYYLYKRD